MPNKGKATAEEKIRIVELYLSVIFTFRRIFFYREKHISHLILE